MLKACWDCIAGLNENREQGENDGAYGIRLNGDTHRAPPWPNSRLDSEIMFLLPRKLNSGDRITISGTMRSNRSQVTVNLITGDRDPDYTNIACQLQALFPFNSPENRVVLKIIDNGTAEVIPGDYQDIPATDWLADTSFTFGFTITVENENFLDIFIGESFLEKVRLKHSIDNIRFLTLHGDVDKIDKLEFKFV